MAAPDLGEWLWRRGTRQHARMIFIMRFAAVTDPTSPRRGAHGFLFIDPCEEAPDGKFCLTVRTTQTEAQIKQNVAVDSFECAATGFLSTALEHGESGLFYRPLIGRVGLRPAETHELERRAKAQGGPEARPVLL